MRVGIIGGGELGKTTARHLLKRGHEVVIVERDGALIDALSDELSCGFVHGDGSRPGILQELGPEQTDVLLCLTDEDLINILAGAVGGTLGFARVVVKLDHPEYLDICRKLDLGATIVPGETIGRYLADMAEGHDVIELSTIVKGDARFFSFTVARDEAGGRIDELGLPSHTRVVCVYRGDTFVLPEADDKLRRNDDVVILTDRSNIAALKQRWQPHSAGESGGGGDRG